MKPTIVEARIPLVDVGADGHGRITRPWMQYFLENTAVSKEAQEKLAIVAKSGSFYSRQAAQTLAAAGLIDQGIQSIAVNVYSGAFDTGGAVYSRVTADQLADYGLSDSTIDLVAFADKYGDFWLLDAEQPTPEMVGGFGSPMGTDPSASAEDMAPYFNALFDYLELVKGGGSVGIGWRQYYCATDLLMTDGSGIVGVETQGRDPRGSASGGDSIDGVYEMPGLVLSAAASVKYLNNCKIRSITIKRAGMVVYTDLLGALNFQRDGFRGTAIQSGSSRATRGVTIENVNLYGFAYGLYARKSPGIWTSGVYGDCTTLTMLHESGETTWMLKQKRKPSLTTTDAIRTQSINVTSVFDSGGFMGCVLAESITGLLQDGERVGNQDFPDPYNSVRSGVTVLGATSIRLNSIPYTAFTPGEKTRISWQPGCASDVVGFYDASGKVGVQTTLELPFEAGHRALLGCATTSTRGLWKILTRVSSTDFVLDVAWDAGLSGETLSECELAAMTNIRRHVDVVSYWGSDQGFGVAAVKCDGVIIDAATKGASGAYLECSPTFISLLNEGGTVGELDINDPDSVGCVVTEPRNALFGCNLKSTATALKVLMPKRKDNLPVFGGEFVDNGRASIELEGGGVSLFHPATRGEGRTILADIDYFLSIQGELRPEKITSSLAADIRRSHWLYAEQEDWYQLHATHNLQAWDASGAVVDIATGTSDAWEWFIPVTSTPKAYSDVPAVTLAYPTHHLAEIVLVSLGAGFSLDATTVPDGFTAYIKNQKGSDFTLPTSWGTGVVAEYALGAVHTKLKSKGWLTLTVRDVGATRYVFLRGDTA